MNSAEVKMVEAWKRSGFVQFGRIAAADIFLRTAYPKTHWVVLSEDAWKAAHKERRARCERMMKQLNINRIGIGEPRAEEIR